MRGLTAIRGGLSGTEGVEASRHIAIATSVAANTAAHFKTLVESVPGISKSLIEPFLNAMLRDAFHGCEFRNPATKATCQLRPKLEILSHVFRHFFDLLPDDSVSCLFALSPANNLWENLFAMSQFEAKPM